MPLILANRVQETTTTAGTGTITLAGAVAGYQSFAAVGNGNTTYYTIVDGNDWEVGIGTYTSAGTTLSRDTVLSSSAAGTKINLSGTAAKVFVDYPAEKAISDGYGTLPVANGGTNATATPTAGAVAYGTGTAYAFTSAGNSGQVLTSAGSGAPTWATPSSGAQDYVLQAIGNTAPPASNQFGLGII